MRQQLADNKQLMDCMDVSQGSGQRSGLCAIPGCYDLFLHVIPSLETYARA